MGTFFCPYCGCTVALDPGKTIVTRYPSFRWDTGIVHSPGMSGRNDESTIAITFLKCPNCGEYTISARGAGQEVQDVNMQIRPTSLAHRYPDFIPSQIKEDYEEACAIISLSPKASATLSRRCLQGMIRDFWQIKKATLYDEISELKNKLSPDLWKALDSLRQLGNIGAHMEKDTSTIVDIDEQEADRLIQLIELLMNEWYIARYERKNLIDDIFTINTNKQKVRHPEQPIE